MLGGSTDDSGSGGASTSVLTRFVAVLSFSRHQLAQPSTSASPLTVDVQVRGGGGGAGALGSGGGGGERQAGHALHLHQLPQ